MSLNTCEECLCAFPPHIMHTPEICLECAKAEGLIPEIASNTEETARIANDLSREAEAVQEMFDAEAEAKRELAERTLARRKLLPFILRQNSAYMPGWVHADICKRLERFAKAIENGESPRLMITMPPRHGKSEIGSKTFPSWYLGRNPKDEVIICSYSGDLVKDFSRKCRDLLESPKYKSMFKTRLDKNSKSVERWNTSQGGAFTAAGVGGPITGRGMALGIIDDPVKNREEAESETTRQKIKDWYSSAFYTRLAPGGGILIIQTRWHDDDLAGWLLNLFEEAKVEAAENEVEIDEDVDQWELVEYPAIALMDEKFRKEGDALHEDRYPLKALRKIKRAMIPRDWEALYQQRPVSEDGDYFTKEMFRYAPLKDRPPLNEMRVYATGDLAISTKQSADYSVFAVVGVDRQQNIWVLDIVRGRWNALGIIDRMFEIQVKYDPELFGLETGQIELTLEPFIQKAEQERGVSLKYHKLKTRGADKGTRARTIQGRMEQGRVIFPTLESTPWMSSVQNELLKFPLGKNDDIVDALAWIGHMLMMLGVRNEKKAKPKKSWKDKLRKHGGSNGSKHKSGMAA